MLPTLLSKTKRIKLSTWPYSQITENSFVVTQGHTYFLFFCLFFFLFLFPIWFAKSPIPLVKIIVRSYNLIVMDHQSLKSHAFQSGVNWFLNIYVFSRFFGQWNLGYMRGSWAKVWKYFCQAFVLQNRSVFLYEKNVSFSAFHPFELRHIFSENRKPK